MGGAVSAGVNNDELINNLLEADYISSADVERVFRAVDRGHYFTPEDKERAYRDLAWKCGNLHISAPCIYSKVMENLKLGPGMSFLNVGSGTGYLSTMAGLLLGSYGTNHGIEIYEDVLNYSTSKLNEFLATSSAIDEYEFCEPKFINGNCLYLGNCIRQYDRVYCGAACPKKYESYMKNLIKIGGILVMPINNQLLQICRISDTNWESKEILTVSFETLISGKTSDSIEPLKMPEADPLSLQEICRFVVRSVLRHIIDIEHPELKIPPRVPWKHMKKRKLRRLIMPIFNRNSDVEENQDSHEATTLVDDSQQLLMDFSSAHTCRSIMEWSQILQGTSAQLFGAIEARCTPVTDAQKNSHVESYIQEDDDDKDEDDDGDDDDDNDEDDDDNANDFVWKNSNFIITSENSNESIFEKMSDDDFMEKNSNFSMASGNSNGSIFEKMSDDEEFFTDIEELHSILPMTEASKTLVNAVHSCDNGENTLETDTGMCKKILEPRKSCSSDDSNPVQVNSYTSYMKEKIKLLPLPMTLKYFLNLNREF